MFLRRVPSGVVIARNGYFAKSLPGLELCLSTKADMVIKIQIVEPAFYVFAHLAQSADPFGEELECFHVAIGAPLAMVGAPLLDLPRLPFMGRLFHNPRENLAVAFSFREFCLQSLGRDPGETKPMSIDGVVVFVFAGHAGQFGSTFINNAREDAIATEAHARAARRTLREIRRVIQICVHARQRNSKKSAVQN